MPRNRPRWGSRTASGAARARPLPISGTAPQLRPARSAQQRREWRQHRCWANKQGLLAAVAAISRASRRIGAAHRRQAAAAAIAAAAPTASICCLQRHQPAAGLPRSAVCLPQVNHRCPPPAAVAAAGSSGNSSGRRAGQPPRLNRQRFAKVHRWWRVQQHRAVELLQLGCTHEARTPCAAGSCGRGGVHRRSLLHLLFHRR